MTGYGQAQGEIDGVTYVVEITTVNSRYLKTNIKLPDSVAFLEQEIDKVIRQRISRGSVNCNVRLKNISADMLFDIDQQALKIYAEKLSAASGPKTGNCTIDIAQLLQLPGIVKPVLPAEEQIEKIKKKILKITAEALKKTKQMRASEGIALAADLEKNCQAIKKNLEKIRSRTDIVLKEYHKRLNKRVNQLLADGKFKLDNETLAREVAVFAERSDIAEEITRLNSHLLQFSKSCGSNDAAGRKLDFISQEMLREANTIASKAGDMKISRYIVDIKCRIDRIKEQVQNVE